MKTVLISGFLSVLVMLAAGVGSSTAQTRPIAGECEKQREILVRALEKKTKRLTAEPTTKRKLERQFLDARKMPELAAYLRCRLE